MILDKEDHHPNGSTSTSNDRNSLDDEEPEFIFPRTDDVPNEHYLRMQMSFDDDNMVSYDDSGFVAEVITRKLQHVNPQILDDKDHKVGKPKYEQPLEEEDHKSFNFIQKIGLLRAQKKQENLTLRPHI